MRQGQQNRRGRGRGNRKGQNPMARSFESAGPDMKIRGTPSHIAEKYMSLARDALSSGDPVLAENYLQHAEHYNRIILSYREQQGHQNGEAMNGGRARNQSPADQESFEDSGEDTSDDLGAAPQPTPRAPAQDFDQSQTGERQSPNRQDGPRRPRGRNSNGARSGSRDRRANASEENGGQSRSEREGFASADDQPEFLRRPVRRTRRSEASPVSDAQSDRASANEESQD